MNFDNKAFVEGMPENLSTNAAFIYQLYMASSIICNNFI